MTFVDEMTQHNIFIPETVASCCWDLVPHRMADVALRVSRDAFEKCSFANDISFWNCKVSVGGCFLITVEIFSDYIYADSKFARSFCCTVTSQIFCPKDYTQPVSLFESASGRRQNLVAGFAPRGVCSNCNYLRL